MLPKEIARTAVLYNPSAGPGREADADARIVSSFKAAGMLPPEIVSMADGVTRANKIIRQKILEGLDALVAAGGDGTVNLAASAIADTDVALGVVPIGTLNHFARDMGLPSDIEDAAKVIAEGHTVQVDVARVNGHLFLNNSSLGFYPTLVMERDRLMKQGIPKTLALVPSAIAAFNRFPNMTVRLIAGSTGLLTRTPFVFVGNNRYTFNGLQAGMRSSLQDGQLQLCAVANASRTALLKAVLLALVGRIKSDPAVILRDVESAQIHTLRRHVRVSIDGEVLRLKSPLEYSIKPGALKVFAPMEGR